MTDENMVATTVRLPQSQIDALDAMSENGEIPNRSEGIRASIGFALDSEEFEVSDDARKLAAYQRTRRLSKVKFYQGGWQQQCRTVLGALADTYPPWDPETVEKYAPQILSPQIETLFDDDEEKESAYQDMREEISRYRDLHEKYGDDPEALAEAVAGDGSPEDAWTPEWKPDVADLADDAADLLADPANTPENVETALSARKNVDDELASAAVSRALQAADDGAQGGVPSDD